MNILQVCAVSSTLIVNIAQHNIYAQTDSTSFADSIPLPILVPSSTAVYDSIADIARDKNRTELFLHCGDIGISDFLRWGMQPLYSRVINVGFSFLPFYANYPRITQLKHLKTLMLPERIFDNNILCDSLHLLSNLEQLEWQADYTLGCPTHTQWLRSMPNMCSLAIRTQSFPMEIFDLPKLNFLDLYVQDTLPITQGHEMPNLKTLVLHDSMPISILNYCTRLEELVYDIPLLLPPIIEKHIYHIRDYIRSHPTLHTVSLQGQLNFSQILPPLHHTIHFADIERDILAKKLPFYRPLTAQRDHYVQRLYYSFDSEDSVMGILFDTPESREPIHTIGIDSKRITNNTLKSLLNFPNIKTLALFGFSVDEFALVKFFNEHQQHFSNLRNLYLPLYPHDKISPDTQAKLQKILPRVKIVFYNFLTFND